MFQMVFLAMGQKCGQDDHTYQDCKNAQCMPDRPTCMIYDSVESCESSVKTLIKSYPNFTCDCTPVNAYYKKEVQYSTQSDLEISYTQLSNQVICTDPDFKYDSPPGMMWWPGLWIASAVFGAVALIGCYKIWKKIDDRIHAMLRERYDMQKIKM